MGIQPADRHLVLCGSRPHLSGLCLLQKSHINLGGWVYHLLLLLHMQPVNMSIIMEVAL